MNRVEEYNSLRAEILDNFSHIKDYRNLAYSATTAILAFSFSNIASKEPLICMIPIAIIIPLCVICERCYMAIYIIDSYLESFYSSDGFLWEKRYSRFKYEMDRDKKTLDIGIGNISTHEMSFLTIIIVCGLLSFYRILLQQYSEIELWIRVVFVVIITFIAVLYICRLRHMVMTQRAQYKSYWNMVKAAEEHHNQI